MLLLFALSIVPKQLLHDAVTGHKHIYAKYDADKNFQSSKSSFQCNWHEQLVESPFISEADFQLPQPLIQHASHKNYYILSYYSASLIFSSLRGPPSQL
jgi:hypothetical protein